MVLVQSAPQSLLSRVHPNPARIFGFAGAIALNIALLMALLVPMQAPPPAPPKEEPIGWQWFDPVKPPPPPPVVDLVKPKPIPTPVVERQRTVVPPVDPPPIVVEQGSAMDVLFVPPVENTASVSEAMVDTAPVAGVRLEYAAAPPPTYPREEMASGTQGTVLLQVLVDVDGRPLEVTIHKSSGSRRLDRAAQQQVLKKWTFRPAMKDGRAIQAIGIVPIDFKLQ